MKILFAVTHINAKLNMRQLTFANQGRNHYHTVEAAQSALDAFKSPLVSSGVITQAEGETLAVRPVKCYDHGDAMAIYFPEPAVDY
jgi:hypothetical protein